MRYKLTGVILLIVYSLVASPTLEAQQVVYLIRHAEPMLDMDDPPLTDAGHQRAKEWAGNLRDAGIKKIYTGERRRARETAEQIAQALNVPLEAMPRRDVHGLVNRLGTMHGNDAILIVSFARTIPKILEAMGYPEQISMEWDEFDTLFVVEPQALDRPSVSRKRFEKGAKVRATEELGFRDMVTEHVAKATESLR